MIANEAKCIGCGCTDLHACPGGCQWIDVSRRLGIGVCTQCVRFVAAYYRKIKEAHQSTVDHSLLDYE